MLTCFNYIRFDVYETRVHKWIFIKCGYSDQYIKSKVLIGNYNAGNVHNQAATQITKGHTRNITRAYQLKINAKQIEPVIQICT